MKLIDVTLRDGGHQNAFHWPRQFAHSYYELAARSKSIDFVEVGYWKQSKKFDGEFYHLDEELLGSLGFTGFAKLAIMIDFHYCTQNLAEYPDEASGVLGLIRLTARREDYKEAVRFLEDLRNRTGAQTSLNIFNVSNYTEVELHEAFDAIAPLPPDYVYLADTHGSLDLEANGEIFERSAHKILEMGASPGFHLHDHSGRGFHNFRLLESLGFEITDISLNGLGKGGGNLHLEHVISGDELVPFLSLWSDNRRMLAMEKSPYDLVAGLASVTDHYSNQAENMEVDLQSFWNFAQSLIREEKDNFDPGKMLSFTGEGASNGDH